MCRAVARFIDYTHVISNEEECNKSERDYEVNDDEDVECVQLGAGDNVWRFNNGRCNLSDLGGDILMWKL